MEEKKSNRRYRDFASVVYPDSENTPDNWIQILKDLHVPALISPLHNNDIDEGAEGGPSPKKPHYHVMLVFDSVKTIDQAKEIYSKIGGVGLEVVKSRRGMARYLCHLDNPEKAQYNKDDVIQCGGVDYLEIISMVADKYATLDAVVHFIKDNCIDNILDLYNYCDEQGLTDWKRICFDKNFVVSNYCKANEYKRKRIIEEMERGKYLSRTDYPDPPERPAESCQN